MDTETPIVVVTELPDPKPSFPWKRFMFAVVVGAAGVSAATYAISRKELDEDSDEDDNTVDVSATI
jgi:hypothetical protein